MAEHEGNILPFLLVSLIGGSISAIDTVYTHKPQQLLPIHSPQGAAAMELHTETEPAGKSFLPNKGSLLFQLELV